MTNHATRRQALLSLPVLTTAFTAWGQSRSPIRVHSLSHITVTVSDRQRAVEFYQGLFGLPIQHRQSSSTGLRIGPGPQYISMAQGGPNSTPRIGHLCLTIDGFNVESILKTLGGHGVSEGGAGPMRARVRMRGPQTPELYFGDPDGISIQLQDVSYCGGTGPLGNNCIPPEPSPTKGLLAVRDYSHCTLRVSDVKRSTQFYQNLFNMPVQANQGPAVLLGVGSNRQFIALAGGSAPRQQSPHIAHGCFIMEGFQPDKVIKALADYGLKPRGSAHGPPGALVFYVSMRGPDRGGATGGTPEVYFTDPDGNLMQIQDVSYCGGSGFLGDFCT